MRDFVATAKETANFLNPLESPKTVQKWFSLSSLVVMAYVLFVLISLLKKICRRQNQLANHYSLANADIQWPIPPVRNSRTPQAESAGNRWATRRSSWVDNRALQFTEEESPMELNHLVPRAVFENEEATFHTVAVQASQQASSAWMFCTCFAHLCIFNPKKKGMKEIKNEEHWVQNNGNKKNKDEIYGANMTQKEKDMVK